MDERRPKQKEGVFPRQVGEEWILYDTVDGSVHVVNATAERVWRLCDGEHSPADIERELRDAFDVPDDSSVGQHVTSVLEQFNEMGIVTDQDA